MFCNQCQDALRNIGCKSIGVCGKRSDAGDLQDKILENIRKIARTFKDDSKGEDLKKILIYLNATSVNTIFDKETLESLLEDSKSLIGKDNIDDNALVIEDEANKGLRDGIINGLKAIASFALEMDYFKATLFILSTIKEMDKEDLSLKDLLELNLKVGDYSLKILKRLEEYNEENYGKRYKMKINNRMSNKKRILISTNNLSQLKEILEESKDKDIDIYTYSSLKRAHYYEEFIKYNNLRGHYGSSWINQREEFEAFNNPILALDGDLVPPKPSYSSLLFTSERTGFSNIKRYEDLDSIITLAKEERMEPKEDNQTQILLEEDFNKILDNLNKKVIRKIVFLLGEDGRSKSREFYSEYAKSLNSNTLLICSSTLLDRVVDTKAKVLNAGEISDFNTIIKLLSFLKESLSLDDINELPITYNISYFANRSFAILLALISYGVRGIYVGPNFPAYLIEDGKKLFCNRFLLKEMQEVKDDKEIDNEEVEEKEIVLKDEIDGRENVAQIVKINPEVADILRSKGMLCLGCPSSQVESLYDAARVHNLDVDNLVKEINDAIKRSENE